MSDDTQRPLSTDNPDSFLQSYYRSIDDFSKAPNAQLAKERVFARIAEVKSQTSMGSAIPASRPGMQHRWITAASVLAGVLCIAGLSHLYKKDSRKAAVNSSAKTYATGVGKRANLKLADGTEITLAPSTDINIDGRTVTLNGQAMFKVVPNTKAPFVVKSNGTSTTVLGTEFVVRAYSGEGKTRIAVQSGRVAVQPLNLTSGNSIVVGANDVVTVSSSGATNVTRDGWIKGDLSWATGQLIFRDTPLGDVLPELSRWTGLDFRVASPEMLQRPLTTSVTSQLTEEEIRAIADALDARYQREGRVVTFVPTQ